MNRLIAIFILTCFIYSSCNNKNNEIGKGNDVNPQSVYFDYQVWGDEDKDDMTIMMQYRFAGPDGTTLVLDDPAKVQVDGKTINVDSSKMSGAYYEVITPLKTFTGHHEIVFTDLDKKQYKEEFNFQPFTLITKIPDVVHRGDLVFHLEGLDSQAYVRVLLTDTSFKSDDINRVDTVKNGKIFISKEDLKKVVNGPVHLELYKEVEKPLKDVTREGGHLSISYGLEREFNLKE